MSDLSAITQAIDIVTHIKKYVPLTSSGDNFSGFCPFHQNTNTPAFYVFPKTKTWHCFGCNTGGDVIEFSKLFHKEAFRDTLTRLISDYKLDTGIIQGQDNAVTYEILDAATAFYQSQLIWSGEQVGDYLTKRGIDSSSIIKFKLGYAAGNANLVGYLRSRDFTEEQIVAAGIARIRAGSVRDTYYNRYIFPIMTNGHVLSFAGRGINKNEKIKYLNGPTTNVFSKGKCLYGFSQAKHEIAETEIAVIVEGYIDVIVAHQAGFSNTVGAMGTTINIDQINMLKNIGAKRIILAMDGDEAGSKATLKIAQLTGIDILIAILPDGKDPDEIILSSPDNWAKILVAAQPAIQYCMDFFLSDYGQLDTVEKKRKYFKKIMPLIAMLPTQVDQAYYLRKLEAILNIPELHITLRCPHCQGKLY